MLLWLLQLLLLWRNNNNRIHFDAQFFVDDRVTLVTRIRFARFCLFRLSGICDYTGDNNNTTIRFGLFGLHFVANHRFRFVFKLDRIFLVSFQGGTFWWRHIWFLTSVISGHSWKGKTRADLVKISTVDKILLCRRKMLSARHFRPYLLTRRLCCCRM